MLMGSARFVNGFPLSKIQLHLNGVPIVLTNKVTNLGISLNSTLNWAEQVRCASSRVNGILWRLKAFSNSLSLDLRSRLVSTLVFPVFDYCAALFTDLTGQQKLKLRRLMNACIRFIFGLRKDEHISHFYDELGWLNADDRREYLTCSLVFNIIHTSSPPYLSENFRPLHRPLSHLRSSPSASLDLAIPFCRTSIYQNSFLSVSCITWNALPPDIREATSLRAFKLSLFSYLKRRGREAGPPVPRPRLTFSGASGHV
jgi:hypothetical protein